MGDRSPGDSRPDPVLRPAEPRDRPAIEALLAACGLPLGGFASHLEHFVVASGARGLVGVAGLELHGRAALLRSVAVAPGARGRGLGGALCRTALARAAALGAHELYLLTLGAEAFFARLGFERIVRGSVPEAIAASEEFASLCPASAVCMRIRLRVP